MKNYLIDLDGTVYRGTEPVEYAKEFIKYLKDNNRKFLFATNCPLNSLDNLALKLQGMGIDCLPSDFINCTMATADYLNENYKGKKVYAIGSKALKDLLLSYGITLCESNADVVVIGYDTEVTYNMLKEACVQILSGAAFIATNLDNTIPFLNTFIPHTGAFVSFLECATGKKATVIGKPEGYMINTACKILNCEKESLCIIGDRLDTDISFGVQNNIDSYLVLTGTTKKYTSDMLPVPTKVFNNLSEIIDFENE